MTRILFLGGSVKSLPLLLSAIEYGHEIVLCDRDPDAPCVTYANYFEQISTVDLPSLVTIGKSYDVGAVMAFGSDIMAESAAFVGNALGVLSNPYGSVVTMNRKDLFREFLKSHGFNVPRSQVSQYKHTFNAEGLSLPVIVKPVDSAGSTGVQRVDDWNDCDLSIENARRFSRTGCVILEEFIQMAHQHMIAGDAFIVDGEVVWWGLLNSHRGCPSAPFLPTGNSSPILINDDQISRIKDEIQRLVDVLGLKFGPLNLELMFDIHDRLYVIELAPRNGGNSILNLLKFSTGVDLIDALVKSSVGEVPTFDISSKPLTWVASYIVHSPVSGVFRSLTLSHELADCVIYKSMEVHEGESVEAFDRALNLIGTIIMNFESLNHQQIILNNITDHIRVEVT